MVPRDDEPTYELGEHTYLALPARCWGRVEEDGHGGYTLSVQVPKPTRAKRRPSALAV